MKILAYGRWTLLALLLILAIPMRADAWEHWNHHWYRYHHVVVPAYGMGYGIAPSYVGVPPILPSYAAVPSYGVVRPYGVPAYVPYPYHLSKHQMAAYNQLGRMERYAATHPVPIIR